MKHAIFTIVQDESFFFPLWYQYYRNHYDLDHIYVLYHPLPGEEKNEPSAWLRDTVSDLTNVVRICHDEVYDHEWLRDQAEKFAAHLLRSYDTVTLTDVDEIIALDTNMFPDGNLVDWIEKWCDRNEPAVRCTGYEVVHRYEEEPAYDSTRGVLRDRNWWYQSWLYSKTLIWRKPPAWSIGFHIAYVPDPRQFGKRVDYMPAMEKGLLLLHLHRFDYGVAAAKLARTASRFTGRDRGGYQNRLQGEDQLKAWWYCDIDKSPTSMGVYQPASLVKIPDHVKNII